MVVTSPYGSVDVPEVSLTELILGQAAGYGERPALVDGPSGRTITYEQLVKGAGAVAAGLQARGFSKGDVFAIFLPNLPEYALVFQGVALAGGINTTINPLYTAEELAFQLNDSKAKFLVTIPQFLDRAIEAKEKSGVEELFVLGEGEGATPFTEVMGTSAPAQVEIDPRNDLVVLPYSSGTTGLPKGVMLTHHNLVANILQAEQCQLVG
ncbi:MAG: AMP-binding protein, partial [Actinomycetota bacterium]